jgi:hypothetical protein
MAVRRRKIRDATVVSDWLGGEIKSFPKGAVIYFCGLPAGIAAVVSGWFGGKK